MNSEPLLTKHEVAALLTLTPETVARMAARGELPARRVANRYRFDRAEVEAWLSRQRVAAREVPK